MELTQFLYLRPVARLMIKQHLRNILEYDEIRRVAELGVTRMISDFPLSVLSVEEDKL